MNAAEVHRGRLELIATMLERQQEFAHRRGVSDPELETAAIHILRALLRPGTADLEALVKLLDRRGELNEVKDRTLAEAAEELRADRDVERADRHGATTRWLRRMLASGERQVQELKTQADADSIRWRTVEDVKREAGVVAAKHDRASWWSLATPPTPSANAEPVGTLLHMPSTSRAEEPSMSRIGSRS